MGNNHIQENTEQHVFHQKYITKQTRIHQTSAVLPGKNVFPQKTYSPPKKIHSPPEKRQNSCIPPKRNIYSKKTKKYSQKVIFPQKMISRNYIPNKSLIPETKSYIPPKKIYSHQKNNLGRDLVFNTYHFARIGYSSRISGTITFFWEYIFFGGIFFVGNITFFWEYNFFLGI